MTPGRRGWIVLLLIAYAAGMLIASRSARSEQGHTHDGAAGRFYQTWMQPDAPWVLCCHDEDCAPAQSRFVDGHWEARWNETDPWVVIPAAKVEQDRETPDGRSHMCGRRARTGEMYVFCFVRGGGV
jgi:hypothetical protein